MDRPVVEQAPTGRQRRAKKVFGIGAIRIGVCGGVVQRVCRKQKGGQHHSRDVSPPGTRKDEAVPQHGH